MDDTTDPRDEAHGADAPPTGPAGAEQPTPQQPSPQRPPEGGTEGGTAGGSAGPAADQRPGAVPPAPSGGAFFAWLRGLGVERTDDRWIGGVSAGLADRLGIDPLIVRGLFVVAFLLSGVGAVAYGIAWALLPERRDGRIHAEELVAGRFDVAVLGAAALVVVGLGRGGRGWWGFQAGPGWTQGFFGVVSGLLWLAFVVAIGITVLVLVTRHHQPGAPRRESPYGPAPTSPTGAYATFPTAYPTADRPAADRPTTDGPTTEHPTTPYATTPYPSSYASGGPAATTATAPATVTTVAEPAKPRRSGPGATSVGIVVALALLSLAGLLLAERSGAFDGPVLLTALGVTAVLAGLGVVVAGLRGRRSGALGFLAIAALVASLPVGATSHRGWSWDGAGFHDANEPVHLTSRTAAEGGLRFGAGEAVLDLTDVPLDDDTLVVPVSVGAGRVEVVVPADAAVEATVRVGLGNVTWDVDGHRATSGGIGLDGRTFQDDASRDGAAQLSLDVSVGAGEVTITREDA